MQNKSTASVDLPNLKARVKLLSEQVGLGLTRSVTKSIAAAEDPEQISDAVVLSALAAKLEDTLRGVERLRRATGVVGQARLSQLCQQMNLAGDCLGDIPNRSVLRQLIEALEKEMCIRDRRTTTRPASWPGTSCGAGHAFTAMSG